MVEERTGGRGCGTVKPTDETRLVIRCNRLSKMALAGFFIGLAILYLPLDSSYNGILVISGVVTIFASTTALFGAFIARDLFVRGKGRFSLRTLLIATTLIALVLGLIVWAAH